MISNETSLRNVGQRDCPIWHEEGLVEANLVQPLDVNVIENSNAVFTSNYSHILNTKGEIHVEWAEQITYSLIRRLVGTFSAEIKMLNAHYDLSDTDPEAVI